MIKSKSKAISGLTERDEAEGSTRISNGKHIYQIGAEIGRGGFAVVFQAFNVETGDFVAVKRFSVKTIDADSLSSIESEIELMRQLNHPNIVQYIDTIRTKDYLHIVLEYMENGALSTVIKKFGSFSESLTAIYVTQVLRGLKYLHEQGVLHRDIKGANILTTKDGMVKLADFGVAMKLSDEHAEQDVVGSPYWIAPEIIEMSAPTSACDIWSVGCIIIELLTRKPPYYDLAPMAALFRIVQDDYPPLPEGISPALRDFLLLCFQKEPVMRASAAKLLEHPWLHNSSATSNLVQTSKLLASQSKSTSSADVQGYSADSIVNTIRNYQMEASSSSSSTLLTSSGSAENSANKPHKRPRGTPSKSSRPQLGSSSQSSASPDLGELGVGPVGRSTAKGHGAGRSMLGRSKSSSISPPPLRESTGGVAAGHTKASQHRRATEPAVSAQTSEQTVSIQPANVDNSTVSRQLSSSGSRQSSPFSEASTVIGPSASKVANRTSHDDSFGLLPHGPSSDIGDDVSGCVDLLSPTKSVSSMYAGMMTQLEASSSSDSDDDSDENWDGELMTGLSASIDSFDRDRSEGVSATESTSGKNVNRLEIDVNAAERTASIAGSRPISSRRQRSTSDQSKAAEQYILSSAAVSELASMSSRPRRSALKSQSMDSYSPSTLAAARAGAFFNKDNNGNSSNNNSNASIPSVVTERRPSFIVNPSGALSQSSFLLSKYQENAEDADFDDLIRSNSGGGENSPRRDLGAARGGVTNPIRKKTGFIAPGSPRVGNDDCISEFDFQEASMEINNKRLSRKLKSYSSQHSANAAAASSGDLSGSRLSLRSRVPLLKGMPGSAFSGTSKPSGEENEDGGDDDFAEFDLVDDEDEERDNDEDDDAESISPGGGMAGRLRQRMEASIREAEDEAGDLEADEFLNYQFDEKDFRQDEGKDVHFRRSREVVDIMARIRADTREREVIDLCQQLMVIFTKYPEQREHLVTYHGVMPIVDMIEARSSSATPAAYARSLNAATPGTRRKILTPFVLRVINKIIEGSTRAQEQLSLVGIIPTIMNIFDRSHRPEHHYSSTPAIMQPYNAEPALKTRRHVGTVSSGGSLTSSSYLQNMNLQANALLSAKEVDPVTLEAARFIHQISSTSSLTLQMLIGAGGLSVLTNMVSFGAKILPRHHPESPSGATVTAEAMSLHNSPNLAAKKKATSFASALISSAQSKMASQSCELTVSLDSPQLSPRQRESGGFMSSSSGSNSQDPFASLPNVPSIDLNTEEDDSSASMSIFLMGIDCISNVFLVQSSRTRDFCRLFVKLGLLPHLAVAFQNMLTMYLARMAAVASANGTTSPMANTPRSRMAMLRDVGKSNSYNAEASGTGTPDQTGNLSSRSLSAGNLLQTATPVTHRKTVSGSSDSTLSQPLQSPTASEALNLSVEKRYTERIATLFSQFSRSDPVVAEMMVHNEFGVITVILSALRASELRATSTEAYGHTANSSSHTLSSFNFVTSTSGTVTNGPDYAHVSQQPPQHHRRKSTGQSSSSFVYLHASYVEIVELLLKCLKNLSMEPGTLADLQTAGTIETLLPLLSGPIAEKCKNHILPCMFNICRINKRRQEQAALQGIIPHLKKVITDGSHLRQFALPILFDLAHTSSATRSELWKNGCVTFYLDLLRENYWQAFAMNSLAIWLSYDTEDVSGVLVQPVNLAKFIEFFGQAPVQTMRTLHKPMYDMMFKSVDLAHALACSSLFLRYLIRRLKTTVEAIVLRSLLKMLQLMHQHHPDPHRLVRENGLYALVEDFAQSEGQVLVCQIASSLLRDFELSDTQL